MFEFRDPVYSSYQGELAAIKICWLNDHLVYLQTKLTNDYLPEHGKYDESTYKNHEFKQGECIN